MLACLKINTKIRSSCPKTRIEAATRGKATRAFGRRLCFERRDKICRRENLVIKAPICVKRKSIAAKASGALDIKRFCVESKSAAGGELYKKVGIIGLNFCFVGGLVAYDLAAPFASVHDNVALSWVRQGLNGAKNSTAGVSSVAGVYINVQRAKAKRAVVA